VPPISTSKRSTTELPHREAELRLELVSGPERSLKDGGRQEALDRVQDHGGRCHPPQSVSIRGRKRRGFVLAGMFDFEIARMSSS